jgi:ABC-type multidrug transport system fused ATPase/permease subunit
MALRVAGLRVVFGDRIGVWNADLLAPAGAVTVIVGPSGAGKSTVLLALLGLVGPPTARVSGSLELVSPTATIPIAELEPRAWRARIGYVPQAPTMLAGTVAANVRLGCPQASDSQVETALREAGLEPSTLRDGLATAVGEGGAGLSVGQARRVGVARALIGDPDIYLLDEPTAALDLGRESDLADTVTRLAGRGRTVLVVSHRPAVIEQADHVVRLGLPPAGARVSHGRPVTGAMGTEATEPRVAQLLGAQ